MDNPQTVRDKVRIRFRKAGDLRLVSHHDLLRCFERMLRRAELPFRSTQGFHPQPRLVFALSLSLGIIGCEEVVELELNAELPTEEIHARLARQTPPGLDILSVRRIPFRGGGQVRCVSYRLDLPAPPAPDLADRAAALLAAAECWIERTRPRSRRIDIRPYLEAIRILPPSPQPLSPAAGERGRGEGPAVEMDLLVTPTGTVRPDEVLEQLGLRDLLDAGCVLQRTRLELHDETDGPNLAGCHAHAGMRMTPDSDEGPLEVSCALPTITSEPDSSGTDYKLQTLPVEGKS